ncbi:taurine catabolism dioxygenase TauD, TfdA family protein [Xylogone sp. PMI_703]|nr:taurine catabolism dioxygenase TauD, TfdA family protein [Xylogone sp. PMI_703]
MSQAIRYPEPLRSSGSLDGYTSFEVTPAIGRDYADLQLAEIVNDDRKVRDLAIAVSERGVVFLHKQVMTEAVQKQLVQKLGELSGKPSTSGLHTHAFSRSNSTVAGEGNTKDEAMYAVSSKDIDTFQDELFSAKKKTFASWAWHSDESYEKIPADYSMLRMLQVPSSGGDTLWVSGYGLYDRLSDPWKRFIDGLYATHVEPDLADMKGVKLNLESRGAPENTGADFRSKHPVVRTNPVTGWKSLFGTGYEVGNGYINDVAAYESELLKAYFLKLITDNHDLQARLRWQENDVAIWDNRAVLHSPTYDHEGVRLGLRVVSIGEKPFLDPNSPSRAQYFASLKNASSNYLK